MSSTEDGSRRGTVTGIPQGGILSPLLANIARSVLNEYPMPGLAELNQQAGCIHLPIEEVTGFYREQGATAHTSDTTSNARRPAASARLGGALAGMAGA